MKARRFSANWPGLVVWCVIVPVYLHAIAAFVVDGGCGV